MPDKTSDLRVEKGKLTRETILNSALEIICNEGIEGLSGAKLAKLSGISKSNVFHHFNTIEEIPFTILGNIGDTLTIELTSRRFNDFRSYLNHLGDITFTSESRDIKFFKAFFSFYKSAMHNDKYNEAVEKCSKSFKSVLKQLIDEFYSISSEKKNNIATLIYSTIDGMGMHYLINSERETYLKAWKEFTGLIVTALEG